MRQYIIASILLSQCFITNVKAERSANELCQELFYRAEELAVSKCFEIPEHKRDAAILKIIGDMYYWGWGNRIAQDYVKSIDYYKEAAGKKNLEAAYNLGVIYETGAGVTAHYESAVKWYRFAAKRGYKDAQYNLANMYAKGAGIKANQNKAAGWYIEAANRGDVASQFNLGNRYARGEGVNVDYVESYKWYSLAMRSGDKEAKKMIEVVRKKMSDTEIDKAKSAIKSWRIITD